MLIDQSTIREVLARTDIGSFIGSYVALRKRGNDLVGLCPFHGEKTPSFHVHPDRGFFKCFGCQAGGDVIKFYQKLENVTFPEALRALAKRAGVQLEEESPQAARARSEKDAIYAANELAANFFARTFAREPEAAAAREYAAKRGLSAATLESFRIGYAPARWDALVRELQSNGVDLALAAKGGLLKAGDRGYYDFYRGRLMIPTASTTGEIVAFGGRSLDGSEPKYLNTSTTPVYTKGRGLYALERARRHIGDADALIVVEGYLDCIALHQAGVRNAVASLGTAFTNDQALELRKYARRIFLAFDADAAGSNATVKSIDVLIAAGCLPFVVQLPPGEDPDTFIRQYGAVAFNERLDAALPFIQFKLDREIATIRERRLPGAQAARTAEELVQALPREEWDRWRVYVAQALGLSADDLRRNRFVSNPANFAPRQGSGFVRHVAVAAEKPSTERELLALLLEEPALLAEYSERIPTDAFRDERYRAFYAVLLAHAGELTTPADVFAIFGGDEESANLIVSLQSYDRTASVRFADSAARRAHLDRIVERLEEGRIEKRIAELRARIDARFEAGESVPADERAESARLVEELNRRRAKRLGAK